jgi:REP element-mobilizing transposase RayT
MGNIRIPLEPDKYYHIFNHAVGRDNLFKCDDNYLFFLKRYRQHILPIADTFAYCLMPNHFHLLVRINPNPNPRGLTDPNPNPRGFKNPEGLVNPEGLDYVKVEHFLSHTFGSLFNSYTKAFNKQQNRKGKLFLENFERKLINEESYLRNIIQYIHFNPVYHGFVDDLRDWKYSSFQCFLTTKATDIKRDEVIEWFDGKENFLAFHHQEVDEKLILAMEYI